MKKPLVRVSLITSLLIFSACSSHCNRYRASRVDSFGTLVVANAATHDFCPQAEEGKPCLMGQREAEQYCASIGEHLPTAREFGNYAVTKGAEGIIETDAKTTKAPSGYYKVSSINPGNKREDVFFSHEGYSQDLGGLGNEKLWTASVVADKPNYAHVFYGAWGGGGGEPAEHERNFKNAVRCVQNK